MSKERAEKIKLILFDVDGVMTDGTIFLFPAPGSSYRKTKTTLRHVPMTAAIPFIVSIVEAKGFNAHDGTGISLARLGGLKTGIITKRISETVALRARDLKLDNVHQGIADKLSVFREILGKENLRAHQVAYVGDDVIDLPVMRNCGLAIAVRNAREEVKDESHYITDHDGGHGGCSRCRGVHPTIARKARAGIAEYIGHRSPAGS